jgi:hypothetical protein
MSMKKLLSTKLKATPALQQLVAQRIYAAGSLGKGNIPAKPKFPFVVFREVDDLALNVAKDTSPNVCQKVFQIYIHDERGSYSRINSIRDVLRDAVRELLDQVSDTGSRCLEAVWNGTSGETEDPTYDSDMRFATFTLKSSK